MFENITAAPADPILGLADLFRADERSGKINLGIGVYKDETGKTPVLTSVNFVDFEGNDHLGTPRVGCKNASG